MTDNGSGEEKACAPSSIGVEESCCPRLLFKLSHPQTGLLIDKHGEGTRLLKQSQAPDWLRDKRQPAT